MERLRGNWGDTGTSAQIVPGDLVPKRADNKFDDLEIGYDMLVAGSSELSGRDAAASPETLEGALAESVEPMVSPSLPTITALRHTTAASAAAISDFDMDSGPSEGRVALVLAPENPPAVCESPLGLWSAPPFSSSTFTAAAPSCSGSSSSPVGTSNACGNRGDGSAFLSTRIRRLGSAPSTRRRASHGRSPVIRARSVGLAATRQPGFAVAASAQTLVAGRLAGCPQPPICGVRKVVLVTPSLGHFPPSNSDTRLLTAVVEAELSGTAGNPDSAVQSVAFGATATEASLALATVEAFEREVRAADMQFQSFADARFCVMPLTFSRVCVLSGAFLPKFM